VLRSALGEDDLRAHCGDRLAAFKVPLRVHVVDAIPKGPTGKVQRRLLAEQLP
jgi:acyl-CoA synthetase (AMP-forming)/AMP-acid ligase II